MTFGYQFNHPLENSLNYLQNLLYLNFFSYDYYKQIKDNDFFEKYKISYKD